MLLGIVSAILIAGAGVLVLHVLGIRCGPIAIGLAPSVGVAVRTAAHGPGALALGLAVGTTCLFLVAVKFSLADRADRDLR